MPCVEWLLCVVETEGLTDHLLDALNPVTNIQVNTHACYNLRELR